MAWRRLRTLSPLVTNDLETFWRDAVVFGETIVLGLAVRLPVVVGWLITRVIVALSQLLISTTYHFLTVFFVAFLLAPPPHLTQGSLQRRGKWQVNSNPFARPPAWRALRRQSFHQTQPFHHRHPQQEGSKESFSQKRQNGKRSYLLVRNKPAPATKTARSLLMYTFSSVFETSSREHPETTVDQPSDAGNWKASFPEFEEAANYLMLTSIAVHELECLVLWWANPDVIETRSNSPNYIERIFLY